MSTDEKKLLEAIASSSFVTQVFSGLLYAHFSVVAPERLHIREIK